MRPADQAATYRRDLCYVQTRFRQRTTRGTITTLHRERVVPRWQWYLWYRWQVVRFRRMKQFRVLVQREAWRARLHRGEIDIQLHA